jgi:hypothetical protein
MAMQTKVTKYIYKAVFISLQHIMSSGHDQIIMLYFHFP